MKAVIYGAGNIGRGFIARLLAAAGYEIIFIDTVVSLINGLNSEKQYPVRLLSAEGSRDILVEGVRAINGLDAEKAAQAIAESDIMATAVGVRVLPLIAPVIAAGLKKRFGTTKEPLNIIICENLIDADTVLAGQIKKYLNNDEAKQIDETKQIIERTGFIKASIGCMVPVQTEAMKDGSSLRICTEDYGKMPVDKKAFRGEIPAVNGMEAYENFSFYMERKLFIHNLGHGVCAYLGMYAGEEFIYQAAARPDILFMAQNAMFESAMALSKLHNEPITDLYSHIMDLLRRFSNRALGDTCLRVGADTSRKLGPKDRFIGAIRCCLNAGIKPNFISAGAAAAIFRHLKEQGKPQSKEEAGRVLGEVSSIAPDTAEAALVLPMYQLLLRENAIEKITKEILSSCR
ncbi:MAG: hypothetical protein FWD78_09140 [Treponema sp.]|nr:hypothetical protein [Treponema sp.]